MTRSSHTAACWQLPSSAATNTTGQLAAYACKAKGSNGTAMLDAAVLGAWHVLTALRTRVSLDACMQTGTATAQEPPHTPAQHAKQAACGSKGWTLCTLAEALKNNSLGCATPACTGLCHTRVHNLCRAFVGREGSLPLTCPFVTVLHKAAVVMCNHHKRHAKALWTACTCVVGTWVKVHVLCQRPLGVASQA